MGINEKITYLQETKELIKDAIEEKGVEVADTDSFRSYADKIKSIPQEGGDPYYEDLYNLRTKNGTDMSGLFARSNGDKLDLTDLDTSNVTDMQYMFSYCKFKNIDCSGWDISKVTNVQYMFENCSSNINTTGWDTSRLTSMNYLFSNFNGSIDISNWDTSNVTSSQYMFTYAKLSNVRGIETLKLPKVTSYEYLFSNAECDTLDLSSWDTSNVTNMNRLFYSTEIRRLDLSNWNTSKVTNMQYIFQFSYNSITEELIIPDWDMTKTTSYSNLFGGSSYTTKLRYIDLSRSNDLTISRITSFLPKRTETTYGEILIPENTAQDIIDSLIAKYWKPIGPALKPTSIQISFDLDELIIGESYTLNITGYEPWYANLDTAELIVSNEENVALDGYTLSGLKTGTVDAYIRLKDTHEVISNTITFSISEVDSYPNVLKFRSEGTPSSSFVKVNGTDICINRMEYDSNSKLYRYDVGEPITSVSFESTKITELIKLNTSNITSMRSMFYGCSSLTSLDVSNWDTSNVTDMYQMLYGCSKLKNLDVSNWDTSNVTDMGNLFQQCSSLTSLDLSSWDTSNVTNMRGMFEYCSSLTSLDLSSWDTSNVTNMSEMFMGCSYLTSLKLSKWDVSNVTNMYSMFYDCSSLASLDLTSFSTMSIPSTVRNYGGMFNGVSCNVKITDSTWTINDVVFSTFAVYGNFKGTVTRV